MRLSQMAIDTTATNRKLQMGGTQFIASGTGRCGRIKMRPSQAARFVPFVIFVAKTLKPQTHRRASRPTRLGSGGALRTLDALRVGEKDRHGGRFSLAPETLKP